MGVTRDAQILSIQQQIADLTDQLEFLQDSDTFYEFTLGAPKTIQYLDFNSDQGKKFVTADDASKLNQEWYKNYSGFMTSEDADHELAFNALRAWLKLFRIHRFIYPSGYPTTNQTLLDTYQWVIKYDTSDADPANWDFVARDVSVYPTDRDNQFYFDSQSNCETAINFMKDSDGSNDDLLALIHLNNF